MTKLSMYKMTFQEKAKDSEHFSIWRLASDHEDAAWQAHEIATGAKWQIIDIAPDEKEQVPT